MVRKTFSLEGYVRRYKKIRRGVYSFQMKKSDHTLSKGKLQSTHIPESKWAEISIGFITDLPISHRKCDRTLVAVNEATRMVHLTPYSKSITVTDTGEL